MWRNFQFVTAIVMMLGIIAGPAWVQAQQSLPGSGSPGAQAGASLEGTVKKVNPAARTVDVSVGMFGLWAKTLEVNNDTQIQMEGRQATLEEIQEGAKVKASYETRLGKSLATRIDVMPGPQPRPAPQPSETPGNPGPKSQ